MSDSARRQLVFVHGIGGVRDAVQERREWLEALAEGARKAGHADSVSGLTQGWLAEARFADYSDLFMVRDTQGSDTGGHDDEQVAFLDSLVRDVIDELGLQAQEQEDKRALRAIEAARNQLPDGDGEWQGLGEPVRVLGRVLTTLLQVPGLRRAAQWASGRTLLGQLAQVGRYLDRGGADGSGQRLDVRIRERVLHGVDLERPLVVVAHSLGSVVAFEALHDYAGSVQLLVTLGSPLATGAAVLQRVRPQPARTPEPVGRWLNFWDRDDIVVARPRVQQWMLPSSSGVVPVTDRVDSDGVWVHTATKYLRQPAVAGPIVEALKQ
ncbi:hypothetical protein [Streptomyces sp. CB02400]|uniref:hypothetical protein n=1 Tax=Streptomyces sp. CB02400 TaxID=1703944 RepID=UPI00093A364A|nr:hypothetical protein [Streptomyces sp. CB02400]OKJ85695.1 hypothetical protein AMK33_38800 [Streptomyces sp. CB02400]